MLLQDTGDQALQWAYEDIFVKPTNDGSLAAWAWQSKEYLNPQVDFRTDHLVVFGKGGTLTVEYSVDKGATFAAFGVGSIVMTAADAEYRLYGQIVTNRIMWKLSGTVDGNFAIDWMSFAFMFEGESR